jgi:hypothetical protein
LNVTFLYESDKSTAQLEKQPRSHTLTSCGGKILVGTGLLKSSGFLIDGDDVDKYLIFIL